MESNTVRDGRRILQLGPLWILSALTGCPSCFTELDRQALADAVLEVSRRTPPEARGLLESIATAGDDLYLDFELDDRSLLSGLWDVVGVLRGMDPEVAADIKLAMLRVGVSVARARGPYGKTITAQGEQQLQLIAELLEMRPQPSEAA